MKIKDTMRAALAAAQRLVGMDVLQAGPRSEQGALNYMSVQTLDPSRLASAFALADTGQISEQAKLFALIEERDPHIYGELAKRRRAVTGLGWKLYPPKDATQPEIDRTAELEAMLRSIPGVEDAQYDLTDAVGKGFAALEIDWRTGLTWLPRALNWVPQHCFQTDRDTGALRLVKQGVGEPLRERGWVVHVHRAKSGYIEQAALFRVLAWTYAYKAYNVKDMQRFLELYGLPLRLGKFPAGIDAKQRDQLMRAVRAIGNDGAGVIPNTMSIDFVQAMKSGSVDDFLSAIQHWENKQSKAILGGDLDGKTTTEARIALYDKVRREILLHDVRQLEPTINAQLVTPINLANGMFAPDRQPRFAYLTQESPDQAKLVEVLTKGVGIGMEISIDYAHEAMQIPRAAKSEPVLRAGAGAAGKAPKSGQAADTALSRLAALAAQDGRQALDIGDAYTAQLAALCAPLEAALIDRIAAIVAEAGSYDEALEKIALLRADPAWAQAMALGMSAAHLAGRADVADDGNA